MKKLLFLVVCCFLIIGCNNRNENSNQSSNSHKDNQNKTESINDKQVYTCSKYNVEAGSNSNITLNIENRKLISKRVSSIYTCSSNGNTTLSCMTIEEFEKDCTFNETETCSFQKNFDNRIVNISITNLNNGKSMIMTETTTYDRIQENYKDIILQYKKENYDCRINTN